MSFQPARELDVRRILWGNTLVPIVVVIALAALLAMQLVRVNDAAGWTAHTTDVKRQLKLVSADVQRIESGQRGYLLSLSPAFKEPYEAARTELGGRLADLERSVADNPEQVAAVRQVRDLIARWDANAQVEMRMAAAHDPGFPAYFTAGKGAGLMQTTWARLREMLDREDALLKTRQERQHEESRLVALSGGIGVLLVLAFFGAFSRRQYVQLDDAFRANVRMVSEANETLQAQNEELQAQSEELQAQTEELQAQQEELQHQAEELQAQSEELQQ